MFVAHTHEQLRQLCRTSGVQVSIEPTNIRDTLYRASVNFVLNVCSRCDIINPSFWSISLFSTKRHLLILLFPPILWNLLAVPLFLFRAPTYSSSIDINGEDASRFLAGFAENIGLQNVRAATIVSAAIAARTRSCLLQAWVIFLL